MCEASRVPRRWFRVTPGRLIAGLCLTVCLLGLSNGLGWPAWHKGYAVLIAVAAAAVVLTIFLLWWLAAIVFRRPFQFSLRSLLMLALIIAVLCPWFGSELRQARRQQSLIAKVLGRVEYDYQFDRNDRLLSNVQPPCPVWLRRLVTDDFFITPVEAEVYNIENDRGYDFHSSVGQLTTLRRLEVWSNPDSADEFSTIGGLTRLEKLVYRDSIEPERAVRELQSIPPMPCVRSLCFESMRVSDDLCEEIVKKFPALRELTIYGASLNSRASSFDTGVAAFAKLARLECLDVRSDCLSCRCLAAFSGSRSIKELRVSVNLPKDLTHLMGVSKWSILKPVASVSVQLRDCPALERLEVLDIDHGVNRTMTEGFYRLREPNWVVQMKGLPKLRELFLELAEASWSDDTSAIENLRLNGSTLPASNLAAFIARCPRLTTLGVRSYQDDATPVLRQLAKSASLRTLDLSGSKLTADAITALSSLLQLRGLSLSSRAINDDTLRQLESLENLQVLNVFGTDVTSRGEKRIEAAIPGLHWESSLPYWYESTRRP